MDLGEGYIEGNVLFFAGTLAAIAAAWFINKWLLSSGLFRVEQVEDTGETCFHYSFL